MVAAVATVDVSNVFNGRHLAKIVVLKRKAIGKYSESISLSRTNLRCNQRKN